MRFCSFAILCGAWWSKAWELCLPCHFCSCLLQVQVFLSATYLHRHCHRHNRHRHNGHPAIAVTVVSNGKAAGAYHGSPTGWKQVCHHYLYPHHLCHNCSPHPAPCVNWLRQTGRGGLSCGEEESSRFLHQHQDRDPPAHYCTVENYCKVEILAQLCAKVTLNSKMHSIMHCTLLHLQTCIY